jgi:hypothetical protein
LLRAAPRDILAQITNSISPLPEAVPTVVAGSAGGITSAVAVSPLQEDTRGVAARTKARAAIPCFWDMAANSSDSA